MNFIVETDGFCISDKGRLYSKFQKKPGAHIQYVRIGSVRPESNAPIDSVEIIKFREFQPYDFREIADLVDEYVLKVYKNEELKEYDNKHKFASHSTGIVGD